MAAGGTTHITVNVYASASPAVPYPRSTGVAGPGGDSTERCDGCGSHGGVSPADDGGLFPGGDGGLSPTAGTSTDVIPPKKIRYYCITRVRRGDEQALGIHHCAWPAILDLLPGNQLFGSGYAVKGFDDLDSAQKHWALMGKQPPAPYLEHGDASKSTHAA